MGRAMPTRTARTKEGASREPSSPSTSSDDDSSTEKLLCSNHSRGRDRLVWAGRSGTANCEKKRGGSQASAYAAISRVAADPRDVAYAAVSRNAADPPDVGPPARGAMPPASTRDAARIAEKRAGQQVLGCERCWLGTPSHQEGALDRHIWCRSQSLFGRFPDLPDWQLRS